MGIQFHPGSPEFVAPHTVEDDRRVQFPHGPDEIRAVKIA